MNALLAAALLSLMLPIRMETGLILVRPFEFLIALGCSGGRSSRRGAASALPVGLLLLLPYLTWHVASATVGGPRNTAREALQVVVVMMFAFLLAQEAPRTRREALLPAVASRHRRDRVRDHRVARRPRLLGRMEADARPAPLVRLPSRGSRGIDPVRRGGKAPKPLISSGPGLFPVLLMSGERKALVIYLILTALLFARGRFALIVPALAAAFVGLLLLSTLIANPYLQKQIRTLVEPGGSGNYEYVLATGRYLPGDTPSDVQRAFALHVSSQMFAEHPFIGVGTNQYEAIVGETYPNAPEELRLAIHGEFQRIVTENGLVGFSLYALIWVVAWTRLSARAARCPPARPADECASEAPAAPPLHSPGALRRDGGLRHPRVRRGDRHLTPA